jgi:hypothetical protein
VPEECVKAAAGKFQAGLRSVHNVWELPIRALSRSRYLDPTAPTAITPEDGSTPPLRVQDSFVWQQGSNYAMAKQLQKWRAIIARSYGHRCSATVCVCVYVCVCVCVYVYARK